MSVPVLFVRLSKLKRVAVVLVALHVLVCLAVLELSPPPDGLGSARILSALSPRPLNLASLWTTLQPTTEPHLPVGIVSLSEAAGPPCARSQGAGSHK